MWAARQSIELTLSPASALRECQRAISSLTWEVLKQTDREITCKEMYPKNHDFLGVPMKPAKIQVSLSPSVGGTTVTVSATYGGFIRVAHLEGLVGMFCNRVVADLPATPQPAGRADSPDQSVVDRLERLASLRANGILSDDEFQDAKKRVLLGQ